MPAAEEVKSSWADEVEETSEDLPPISEVRDNGLKIVTEYRRNDDGKKVSPVCRSRKGEVSLESLIANLHRYILPINTSSKYDNPHLVDLHVRPPSRNV